MAKNIQCTINITEVDGKLAIFANIPDGMEDTVAGMLAKALIEQSAIIMNDVLGDNQSVERLTSQ